MQHAQNSGWIHKTDGSVVRGRNAAEVAALHWRVEYVPVAEALAAPMGGKAVAVVVYANHGRWVVECPDCHSAQLACPDDHRFMCSECANAGVDGVWRPVAWPKDAEKIAELLDARHEITSRSWEPYETVQDLHHQNVILANGGEPVLVTQASDFEDHTHTWGKPDGDGRRACKGCPEFLAPGHFEELAKQETR